MKENSVILISISIDEFKKIVTSCIPQSTTSTNVVDGKHDSIFLTVQEAAKFLKVSEVSIHKWKKSKGLKYYRVGRRIRFKKEDLIDFTNLRRKTK